VVQGIISAILSRTVFPSVFSISEAMLFVDGTTRNVINVLNSLIDTPPSIH